MLLQRLMAVRRPFLSIALPVSAFQLAVAAFAYEISDQSLVIEFFDTNVRVLGTLTMMGLLPGYFIAAMSWLMRQSGSTLDQMAPFGEAEALAVARHRLTSVG